MCSISAVGAIWYHSTTSAFTFYILACVHGSLGSFKCGRRRRINVRVINLGYKCTNAHVRSPHTLTNTHIYTFTLPLLLRLAEVVAEVVIARRFRDDGSSVRDRNVLQVQEAELNLHGEEDVQLAVH